MSNSLRKDLEKRQKALNKVFVKHSPREFWKPTGCIVQVCGGFKNGKILRCRKKHQHWYVFYYMTPFQRVLNWIRMFLGIKPRIFTYHFDPNNESTRDHMYVMGCKALHQPEVAEWFLEACLHPTYAHWIRKAMRKVLKNEDCS